MANRDRHITGKDRHVYRTFVRFGRLKPVKQEGYGIDSYHAPPAPVGFYAMPKRLQEFFLIGSIEMTQDIGLSPKHRDITVDGSKPVKKATKSERISAVRHEFVVGPEVEMWHHLTVPASEIIDQHGFWVKTTVAAWEIAVKKERIRLRAQSLAIWGTDGKNDGKVNKQDINTVRKSTGVYSKDHFEVFFDHKVA